ncbi:MAG: hypothetical protein H6683_10125 [Deltaproteobacteria bacterium]|nr:hypothetical protein [Deltaproteobacteria bacterium]
MEESKRRKPATRQPNSTRRQISEERSPLRILEACSPLGKPPPPDLAWVGFWGSRREFFAGGIINQSKWSDLNETAKAQLRTWWDFHRFTVELNEGEESHLRNILIRSNPTSHAYKSFLEERQRDIDEDRREYDELDAEGVAKGQKPLFQKFREIFGDPEQGIYPIDATHRIPNASNEVQELWLDPKNGFEHSDHWLRQNYSAALASLVAFDDSRTDKTKGRLFLKETPLLVALASIAGIPEFNRWFPTRFESAKLIPVAQGIVRDVVDAFTWYKSVGSWLNGKRMKNDLVKRMEAIEKLCVLLLPELHAINGTYNFLYGLRNLTGLGSNVEISRPLASEVNPESEIVRRFFRKNKILREYLSLYNADEPTDDCPIPSNGFSLPEIGEMIEDSLLPTAHYIKAASGKQLGRESDLGIQQLTARLAEIFDFYSTWWRMDYGFQDYTRHRKNFVDTCLDIVGETRSPDTIDRWLPRVPPGIKKEIRDSRQSRPHRKHGRK